MAKFFTKNKKATFDWLGQRASAVLMLVIGIYLAVVVVRNNFILPTLADLAGDKLVIIIALGVWALFDHGKWGLAVIIEDYVHGAVLQRVALFFNQAAALVFKILTLVVAYYIFTGAV